MANRNSLIELLEDLTTGKDYEQPKKNLKTENTSSSQDKKPKVFDYDHKFSNAKSEEFNQRYVVPTMPSDYGSHFPTQRINNDYFVPNKSYPPPSWPLNFDPLKFYSQSGHMSNNPNVVGFGHYSQPSSAVGACHVQTPFNINSINAQMDQKLNCVPFSPNSDKSIISSPAPYGVGFNAGRQLPHFDANTVRPSNQSEVQSGSLNAVKGFCNKPIPFPNQYFQNTCEYSNETNVLNPFKNNSPGMSNKELNIACKPNSSSNLNLIPPPSPPVLFQNFKNKSKNCEAVKVNSNAKTSYIRSSFRGPRTPPLSSPNSSSERFYSSSKGPRTPPMKGKGPCTPPQKGPHTPPLKGPRTPPIRSPPIPSKGPCTPPTSPLPPHSISDKPPLPTSLPVTNELKLKNAEPLNSQYQKIKIMRRRSQELSSTDSDSSDKPDTFYPDYRRKSQDSPENCQLRKDIIPTNSVCVDNLQGNYDVSFEEPTVKDSCNNYFYGSSFFKKNSVDDSHRDIRSDIDKKKVKYKIKDKQENDFSEKMKLKSTGLSKNDESKDSFKPVPDNCNSGIPEKNDLDTPKNNFSVLQCSDSSDDKDNSTDESSCNENSYKSGSESGHSPFIKYSDYEELLNLEAKRLTMEQELSQVDIETELNVINESNSLVDLEYGSPVLYDLPDVSPPPLSSLAPLLSGSPTPHSVEESGKPKYPRYFKDKVAFSSSYQPPFNEVHLHSPEQNYNDKKGSLASLRPKELPIFDEIQNYSKNVTTNAIKVAKTPLIKRLGLVEESSSNATEEPMVKVTPVFQNKLIQQKSKTSTADRNIQLLITPSSNECMQNIDITKETPKPVRKLVIVENQEGKLTKVKLASPTFPEKKIPAKMKPKESKEFLQTSSKNKAILRTPKGRGYTKKLTEKRNVKASPMRLDLDSRIKILFGTKDSPQKSSNFDSPSKYHYKNYPPLSRPPSPFCNRNLYLYWHRETYYFRKHNPNPPPGSVDPMLRRKIGIQITHQSSLPLGSKTKSSFNTKLESEGKSEHALEQMEPIATLTLSPKLCQLETPNIADANLLECQVISDQSKKIISNCNQIGETERKGEKNIFSSLTTVNNVTKSTSKAEITRIDVPPNNELELVSEPTEIEFKNNSGSNEQALENSKKRPEDMVIEMILSKLIDSFKDSLKRKITDSVVDNEDIWDSFKSPKIPKSE